MNDPDKTPTDTRVKCIHCGEPVELVPPGTVMHEIEQNQDGWVTRVLVVCPVLK